MTRPPGREPTGWGTTRRLRALMNRGWSARAIQAVTGIPAGQVTAAASGQPRASRGLDRRVAAAYELLWNQPPPQATPADRARAAHARATAERHGWAPPMAWDDEMIDQPAGRPAAGWRPARGYHRAADLVEDMAWIREHGGYQRAPLPVIAERLGVTTAALQKASSRVASRQAEAG